MRIVLDASPLVRGQTGIGTYTRELVLALRALAPEDEITLFLNRPSPRLRLPDLDGWRPRVRGCRLPRRWLNRIWLARRAFAVDRWFPGAEVFHATDFLVPFSRCMKLVATVHDLAWAVAPRFFEPSFVEYFGRWFSPSVRMTHAVLTPSMAVAEDLVRLFDVDARRVHAVASGVGPPFGPASGPGEDDAATRAGLGVSEPYLLAVGPIEPRKNLAGLLAAFELLAGRPHRHEALVVAGRGRPRAAGELRAAAARRGLAGRVVLTGPLDRNALAVLYRGASLFVYPSWMEGFGLPVLEAMACATPVVASHAPAIRETAGGAALHFDPGNVEAMARAIEDVLDEPGRAAEMRQQGIERARALTWERCAGQTRGVYEEAA